MDVVPARLAQYGDPLDALGNGCVEVATNLPGLVAIRDSKNPYGPMLAFTPTDWQEFIDGVKVGRHDLA